MAKDWTKLYKKYPGLWVALAEDEVTVVASGKTAPEVFKLARKKTNKVPLLTYVPEKLVTYVGFQ